jgi:hypothetical protein
MNAKVVGFWDDAVPPPDLIECLSAQGIEVLDRNFAVGYDGMDCCAEALANSSCFGVV